MRNLILVRWKSIYWLKLKGFFRLRASLKSIAYRMSIKFWRKSQYFSTLPRILNLSIINIHYYANQMVCFAFLINAILWYENYFRQQNSNINNTFFKSFLIFFFRFSFSRICEPIFKFVWTLTVWFQKLIKVLFWDSVPPQRFH